MCKKKNSWAEVAYSPSSEERSTKVNKFELIVIELFKCYQYLGIWIDGSLNFKPHVLNPMRRPGLKLFFYFWNKLCFSLDVKKLHFYLCWTMGIFCTCKPLPSVSIGLIKFTIRHWGWSQIRLWQTIACQTLGKDGLLLQPAGSHTGIPSFIKQSLICSKHTSVFSLN